MHNQKGSETINLALPKWMNRLNEWIVICQSYPANMLLLEKHLDEGAY